MTQRQRTLVLETIYFWTGIPLAIDQVLRDTFCPCPVDGVGQQTYKERFLRVKTTDVLGLLVPLSFSWRKVAAEGTVVHDSLLCYTHETGDLSPN